MLIEPKVGMMSATISSRSMSRVRVSDVAQVGVGKPLRTGAAQLGADQTVLCTVCGAH